MVFDDRHFPFLLPIFLIFSLFFFFLPTPHLSFIPAIKKSIPSSSSPCRFCVDLVLGWLFVFGCGFFFFGKFCCCFLLFAKNNTQHKHPPTKKKKPFVSNPRRCLVARLVRFADLCVCVCTCAWFVRALLPSFSLLFPSFFQPIFHFRFPIALFPALLFFPLPIALFPDNPLSPLPPTPPLFPTLSPLNFFFTATTLSFFHHVYQD